MYIVITLQMFWQKKVHTFPSGLCLCNHASLFWSLRLKEIETSCLIISVCNQTAGSYYNINTHVPSPKKVVKKM